MTPAPPPSPTTELWGGALLGVAVLIDAEGDDVYRGTDGTMGAGLFGVGLLADLGGGPERSFRRL